MRIVGWRKWTLTVVSTLMGFWLAKHGILDGHGWAWFQSGILGVHGGASALNKVKGGPG